MITYCGNILMMIRYLRSIVAFLIITVMEQGTEKQFMQVNV